MTVCDIAYGPLASVYDAIGLSQRCAALAHLLVKMLEKPGKVLDVCCGTGVAAQIFAEQGWQVTAVDQSLDMLEIARARARDSHLAIEYVQDDVCALEHVHGRFDHISCFGDSLAELVEEGDLADCFQALAEHLHPGGLLAFDMRRRSLYERWDAVSEVLHDDHALLAYVERDYVAHDSLASQRYVWFVREIDLWWREETTIDTRFYDDASLNEALEQAGLRILQRLTLEGQPASDDQEWLLFLVTQSC